MKVEGVIWLRDVVDKLAFKHPVQTHEVEQLLANNPKFRFVEKGNRKGEYWDQMPEAHFDVNIKRKKHPKNRD